MARGNRFWATLHTHSWGSRANLGCDRVLLIVKQKKKAASDGSGASVIIPTPEVPPLLIKGERPLHPAHIIASAVRPAQKSIQWTAPHPIDHTLIKASWHIHYPECLQEETLGWCGTVSVIFYRNSSALGPSLLLKEIMRMNLSNCGLCRHGDLMRHERKKLKKNPCANSEKLRRFRVLFNIHQCTEFHMEQTQATFPVLNVGLCYFWCSSCSIYTVDKNGGEGKAPDRFQHSDACSDVLTFSL